MNTEIWVTLLSGQLLVIAWQIYKEIRDHKQMKKDKQDEKFMANQDLKEMVFNLYRDSLRHRILAVRKHIDTNENGIDLSAELMDLHNDMQLYLKCGGNGIIKHLYLDLKDYVRERKGEKYYAILCIEGLHHTH